MSNVELSIGTGTIKNLSAGRQAYLYEFFVQGEDRREEKLQIQINYQNKKFNKSNHNKVPIAEQALNSDRDCASHWMQAPSNIAWLSQ